MTMKRLEEKLEAYKRELDERRRRRRRRRNKTSSMGPL